MKHLKSYNESYRQVTVDKISEMIQLYKDCFVDIIDAGAFITIEAVKDSNSVYVGRMQGPQDFNIMDSVGSGFH